MNTTTTDKKIFIALWVLCILGVLSILPYALYMGILPPAASLSEILLLGTLQAALLYGLICWASFKILPKTDLEPFPRLRGKDFLKKLVYPALIAGVGVGLIIWIFDQIFFDHSMLAKAHPPLWVGALASLYGTVNEEVLSRLFLLTLIYFLVGKCVRIHAGNRSMILWGVTIFVALLFGMGHLPAAFKLMSPSTAEIFRILFLNAIAGTVFGWLYWSYGLWTAMAAHFVTDVMIHVLLT